ncbi:MAG: hypothetical protein DI539_17855 [Flavobacterium psychrophilum]|nr:MAG: hypothetical protein DI539_17855 [Flavobacterium psychrophilum]
MAVPVIKSLLQIHLKKIAKMVSMHAREMVANGDAAQIEAMNDMRTKMTTQDAAIAWMNEKRNAFNNLPDTI